MDEHFNTSYVSINRSNSFSCIFLKPHFNTSYVSINPNMYERVKRLYLFQYILCFY